MGDGEFGVLYVFLYFCMVYYGLLYGYGFNLKTKDKAIVYEKSMFAPGELDGLQLC